MAAQLTTQEAFLESILHDEHIILGREMFPFCLEMWCILEALESPLIRQGEIRIEDIQLAVLACSTSSVKEFYRLTRRPSLRQQLWKIVTRGTMVDKALQAFNTYINDYVPMFPRWENTDGGVTHEFKCPEVFLCAARLFSVGHTDHEICREIPLGKILSWKLAMDESKGDPLEYIQSETEMEALKQIEGMS